MKTIKVGLIGLGTVGVGVVKTFLKNSNLICARLGLNLQLTTIVDLDVTRDRGVDLGSFELTTDAQRILSNPEIEIVIELIGGTTFAKDFIVKALQNKKHVVTANKALLSHYGKELSELAAANNVSLLYEASVAGGIPIIKAVEDSFQANKITSFCGIINGTANYILTKMARQKLEFADALKQAADKGYAEADPSLDIDGIDSAHKLAILASLCFDTWVAFDDVYVEGISEITAGDIEYADKLGYIIKLLAIARECNGEIEARVHPTFVPKTNMLASVTDTFNAVLLNGNILGEVLLYGRGAGEMPTASAVVSDVISIAKNIKDSIVKTAPLNKTSKKLKPVGDTEFRAYLKIMVEDKPGVLAQIATILGKLGISISSVIQKEGDTINSVPLILMLHKAKLSHIKEAMSEIEGLSVVNGKITMISVWE